MPGNVFHGSALCPYKQGEPPLGDGRWRAQLFAEATPEMESALEVVGFYKMERPPFQTMKPEVDIFAFWCNSYQEGMDGLIKAMRML